MSILGSAFSLFLVYNVMGNLPFYIAILKPYDAKRQKIILIREMLIALGILFLFGYAGDSILHFLGITKGIIGVAGGILLFLISLTMIFPKHTTGGIPEHEPFIIPIATPCMAGPGSISAVMLLAETLGSPMEVALVIFLAWLPSLAILLVASYIRYLVGEKGLIAFERFGGLLIALIAVQMISSGVVNLVKDNFYKTPRSEVVGNYAVARS
ncbi:MAG: MarC family protein [Verrucomicrobia bacterium]|nr:MarC family protein [Verrucomicrobiota bacterium]